MVLRQIIRQMLWQCLWIRPQDDNKEHFCCTTECKDTHTMMLLIGIWISFTKNPINPMIANPIAVAMAIFWNSTVDIINTNHRTNTEHRISQTVASIQVKIRECPPSFPPFPLSFLLPPTPSLSPFPPSFWGCPDTVDTNGLTPKITNMLILLNSNVNNVLVMISIFAQLYVWLKWFGDHTFAQADPGPDSK